MTFCCVFQENEYWVFDVSSIAGGSPGGGVSHLSRDMSWLGIVKRPERTRRQATRWNNLRFKCDRVYRLHWQHCILHAISIVYRVHMMSCTATSHVVRAACSLLGDRQTEWLWKSDAEDDDDADDVMAADAGRWTARLVLPYYVVVLVISGEWVQKVGVAESCKFPTEEISCLLYTSPSPRD